MIVFAAGRQSIHGGTRIRATRFDGLSWLGRRRVRVSFRFGFRVRVRVAMATVNHFQ
jgi:hypothetical protein